MAELSEPTKNLIRRYENWQQSLQPKQGLSTIHVDEVASRVAAFYEQIRTIVEWKEEHLMRRAAIIRKLKRRFLDLELNNFSQEENMAESLVLELIRGGHFPNDKIEESLIADVERVIIKYIFILKNSPENKIDKTELQFYGWLLEIAACEIEEILAPPLKETALMDYMFELMKERIKVNKNIFDSGLLEKGDEDVQIYIALQQALFKLDNPIISYNLIKYKYPQWNRADKDLMFKVAQNAYKIYHDIEKDLLNPLSKKFYAICEKYDTPYLLLGDILSQGKPKEITKQVSEPSVLEGLIRDAYNKRLFSLKNRIWRAAFYSTISIFITKILSLLILEILLSKITTEELSIVTLIADIFIPTVLMFTLVATIKPPSDKNLNLVIMETMKIVYKKEKIDVYEVKIRKKGVVTKAIISFIYILSGFVSFGLTYYIFKFFNFPIPSIIINIIFIALILFAGTAVRKRAQELSVEEESEGFLSFLSDVFFLPMQGFGRWLSNKWKKYNAITAFFNALIDMPFSVFIEFLEKWRYFIKERKEEIR
ncbi:MAG: hypothetical protein Q8O66_01315 [bacterium]|nr:hypothetical protein [bacterium]